MKVIPPLEITTARLTSTTVAEPDATTGEVIWVAATAYTLGQKVIRTTTHRKYENVLAGTDAGLPENTPTRWLDVGPTNRFAMFDVLRNTQTVTASPLTVQITAGQRVDSIAVMAMEAESITVSMMNGVDSVYSYTENLNTREVLNWFDYFFAPFSTTPSIVKFDLPPFSAGVITVTITSTTGTVKCGAVVIGSNTDIGKLQYNAVSEELNFSRIDREFDGTSILLQRRSIPKLIGQVFGDKSNVNKVRNLRKVLNAVPAVWSGLDGDNTDGYFESTLILGVYKRFEIDLSHPENMMINLEVEEV